MSKEVDTRVVQMKFDNRQFEKNVQETLTSLEKLDESLQFKDAAKGFEKISQSAKEVNLSGMSKAVDAVKVKFSALEVAAISAINNITNKAINAGERLVKSLSVDNVAAGWQKFEDTTTSVGTLISQGFSMDEVEKQLARLNWFTDETSYNFTDMVNNIGKFTATGQSLDDSVKAMEGIANWAALSGANAQKASQAMYQLAQAMGKGALKYDDYKSIQNVNMDTREFRQIALEAAVAAGTLKDNLDGTYTTLKKHTFDINSFGNYLSTDAWLTSDVMIKSFSKYASAVDFLYGKIGTINEKTGKKIETASEAIEVFSDQIDKFGLKAFKAAQEARTWTDVISSVKDAVSSKWKETFEIIFGNYKEAKALFTGLANLFYDIFAAGGEERNSILKEWKENNGRTTLLNALGAAFLAVRDAINAVKEAFREIFPKKTAQDLVALTEKFRDFTYRLLLNEQQLKNLKDTFKGFFSIIKVVKDTILGIIKALFPGMSAINSMTSLILAFTGAIGRVLIAFSEWINKSKILSTILSVLSSIIKIIAKAIIIIVAVLYSAAKALGNLIKNISKTKIGQKILNALADAFMFLVNSIQYAYNGLVNFITILSDPVLVEQSNNPVIKVLSTIINIVKALGQTLINTVSNIVSFIKSLSGMSIGQMLTAIWNKIVEIKNTIINKLFGETEKGGSSLINIINKLRDAFDALFKKIDAGQIIAVALTIAMIGVAGALAGLLKNASLLFGNASGLLKTIKNVIMKTYAKSVGILNIAEAFAILAASLWVLSTIKTEKLQSTIDSVLQLITGMVIAYGALTLINKYVLKTEEMINAVTNIGKILIGFGVAMLGIATAMLILENIKFTGNLIGNLSIAILAIGMLGMIAVMVSKFSGKASLGVIVNLLVMTFALTKIV